MLHPTTFSLRQFYGIEFSPGILLGQLSGVVFQHFLFEAILRNCIIKIFLLRQFYELYSQNISFKTTLRSRIIQKSLWGNSVKLYSQNIHCNTTLRSCIPTFCLKATLRSCISTILLSRQFYGIVFSKYFL